MSIFFWGLTATMLVAAIAIVGFPQESGKREWRSPRFLFIALVPVTAIGLYLVLGTPAAITNDAGQAHRGTGSAGNDANAGENTGLPTVANLVNGLEVRLQQEPDDGAGWLLLAQSYDHLGQRSEALVAYERAKSLGKSHPELEKSLSRANSASAVVANDSSSAIRGRLSLSPEVAVQVQASDTIFIFAKESLEQRMPVAALRKSVADLPFDFVLSDEQAMVPGTHLNDYEQLIIVARVSRSGNAGDTLKGFETTTAPISPMTGDNIELLITANVTTESLINE